MNIYTLWENDTFSISTPKNPHMPYSEGAHIIVSPKQELPNAWTDLDLSTATFRLATEACQVMERLQLSPWFNIQANDNWGLLPGNQPFFHVHVYGRNQTDRWGKPVILPDAPGTYQNDPMPETDRAALAEAFNASLAA